MRVQSKPVSLACPSMRKGPRTSSRKRTETRRSSTITQSRHVSTRWGMFGGESSGAPPASRGATQKVGRGLTALDPVLLDPKGGVGKAASGVRKGSKAATRPVAFVSAS